MALLSDVGSTGRVESKKRASGNQMRKPGKRAIHDPAVALLRTVFMNKRPLNESPVLRRLESRMHVEMSTTNIALRYLL
jgi:hypothetical protein